LILTFGVDYRYVERLYRADAALRLRRLPLRMLVPCVVSLVMVGGLQVFLHPDVHGLAIMAVAAGPGALQLMACEPDPHQAHRVRHLDRNRLAPPARS